MAHIGLCGLIVYWDLYWGPPIWGSHHMWCKGNDSAFHRAPAARPR